MRQRQEEYVPRTRDRKTSGRRAVAFSRRGGRLVDDVTDVEAWRRCDLDRDAHRRADEYARVKIRTSELAEDAASLGDEDSYYALVSWLMNEHGLDGDAACERANELIDQIRVRNSSFGSKEVTDV